MKSDLPIEPTSAFASPTGTGTGADEGFVVDQWEAVLHDNHLVSFGDFWNAPGETIDDRNIARGGWSSVTRLKLKLPSDGTARVYVKRQLNYRTRTWRRPLRGEPTLQREFRALEHCRRHGVPTASLVYFGTARVEEKPAAVLVTAALDDFEPLNVFFGSRRDDATRRAVLCSIARALKRLHASGLKHGCLYPKHIFVRVTGTEPPEVRFIDFEKARRYLFRRSAIKRDFGTLLRRLPMCSAADLNSFHTTYCSAR